MVFLGAVSSISNLTLARVGVQVEIGRLHVLTDYRFQQRWPHCKLAEMAIRGGASTIQFREKHAPIRHALREAELTAAYCRAGGVPLVVDDRLDLALAIGADGVHLGKEDFPISVARRTLGDGAIIGATATTVEDARRAEGDGASYVGFGPVYATTSKANPASVKGLSGLAAVCAAVRLPVIAIAGITAERVPSVMEAGAHGVAVMTAVTLAADPVAATAALAAAVRMSIEP